MHWGRLTVDVLARACVFRHKRADATVCMWVCEHRCVLEDVSHILFTVGVLSPLTVSTKTADV